MPTIATSQLPIPKDWNEFEDICADLFRPNWACPGFVDRRGLGSSQNAALILAFELGLGHHREQPGSKSQWREKRALVLVEECKAPDFKKPDHCRSWPVTLASMDRRKGIRASPIWRRTPPRPRPQSHAVLPSSRATASFAGECVGCCRKSSVMSRSVRSPLPLGMGAVTGCTCF
jgi:hypothetical protein